MAKATKNPKAAKAAITAIPTFLDKDGKILMVTETKKNDKGEQRTKVSPLRLGGGDFPKTGEGKKAFCRYQIAMWTWKESVAGTRGSDPVAKAERKVSRMAERLDALKAELAKAKAAAK